MINVTNINEQNPNFQARLRLRKKKNVKAPLILSFSGIWSTGAVLGYGFGHYGKDVFKPSVIKEKVSKTKNIIDSNITTIKSNIKQKTKDVKEFFGIDSAG